MARNPYPRRTVVAAAAFAFVASGCVAAAGGSDQPATTRAPRQTTTTTMPFQDAAPDDLGDPLAPGLGNGGYDVSHYRIDLTYDPPAPEDEQSESDEIVEVEPPPAQARLRSITEIELTATAALDHVVFDFTGATVQVVRVDDAGATFEREPDKLIVTLPKPAAVDDTLTIHVEYEGSPGADGSRMARHDVGWVPTADDGWFLRADPDGAHRWFPVNDHPSDRATFQIDLDVPITMAAAASGVLERQFSGVERASYRWAVADPVAPHRVAVAIGPMEIVTDDRGPVDLRHALPPDLAQKPPGALDTVTRMVDFFEERIGPYPYDSFGVMVVDGPVAGLGAHGWATLTREQIEAEDAELTIVNHLASQWFGDAVLPADWSDVWLATSVGQYAEWLWIEAALGDRAADLTASTARRSVERAAWPPPDSPREGDLYVGSVFLHGAITLHALRLRMGDASFFDLLEALYQNHRGDTLTTAALLDAVDEAGGRELTFLVEAWLYNDDLPGFPDR